MDISGLRARLREGWFYGLLALIILALYWPALRFGLIWDDPRYYHGVWSQSSLWQIFTSPQPPTYQFYRPVAVLYSHLFISPDGVVNAPWAHALQIAAHLVATLTLAPVLRAFRFDLLHARLAALCFAIYPLSYYGVAWQQNQQPWMLMWLLLAVFAAQQFCACRRIVFLGLSLGAYALALLFQEGAAPFVFVFFWLALAHRREIPQRYWRWWPLLHLALVGLYALMWLTMPIQRAVTGRGFQPIVLAYFAQGLVFPLSHLLVGWLTDWSLAGLLTFFAAVWLLLTFGLWKWGLGHTLPMSWAWTAVGILPLWAGLSWGYAQLGARLLYPAAVGMAGIWGGWMALAVTGRGWRRALGVVAFVSVLGVSLQQWRQFQRLHQVGTEHLARAVEVLSQAPGPRQLFVNFPDRLEFRPAPYPLGFWGLTLAPVVQDLRDYALAAHGQSAEDRSLSVFIAGAGDREAWPYRVDMRGVNSDPAALFNAALWADAVYLSDYLPDGALRLREVGDARPADSSSGFIAGFGDAVQLVEADVSQADGLHIRLVWRCLKPPQPDDTILVHFWQGETFVGGADGDSLGGLVPPAAWQPGTEIVDVRQIDLTQFGPGTYQVRVGLYDRTTGQRYRAVAGQSDWVRDDAFLIGEFHVP